MKVVSFCKLKGGVGATTISYSFAEYLAKEGNKVLLIDLDHQLNLTSLYGAFKTENTIYNAFTGKDILIDNEVRENLFLISGSFSLDDLEVILSVHNNPNKLLYNWFAQRYDSDLSKFDYVILDTRPEFSTIVKNAIMISDYIICPLVPSEFSEMSRDNIEYRLEAFRKDFSDFKTGKSDVVAKLLYIGNLIGQNKAGKKFLEDYVGRTIANFPNRTIFNRTITDSQPIHVLAQDSRIRNDNKGLFESIENEFAKMKAAIDK